MKVINIWLGDKCQIQLQKVLALPAADLDKPE